MLKSLKNLDTLQLEGSTLGVPETERPRRSYSFLSAHSNTSSGDLNNSDSGHRPSPVGQSNIPGIEHDGLAVMNAGSDGTTPPVSITVSKASEDTLPSSYSSGIEEVPQMTQ